MRRADKPSERRAGSARGRPRRSVARPDPTRVPEQRLRELRALILDCDGVLTPGDLIYDQAGQRLLRFCARDGFGLAALCRSGFPVAVLSGRPVDIAEQRLRELGVGPFLGKCKDKARGVVALCDSLHVTPSECAFVGDDVPDLQAFAAVGLRIAVADAAPDLVARADWVTRAPGGRGAVREVCEAILRSRGLWQKIVDGFERGGVTPRS
jgi:3-deoxy-D-manno-octulosonate 8-phosphate phosphatase (KDO 8-P phosphatase)